MTSPAPILSPARLEEIWKRVRRLNRYVEETRPWDLAKDDAQAERLDQVLYNLAEGLRVTTLLLTAYMPETGNSIVEMLPPLFPKIEAAAA